jgi:glycosyltransferase involved in cell wall biosynthesis
MPTICLNMIVKNEEKIIERLLNSVINIIDFFVIVDTGSDDNTINIIKDFFSKYNIKGILAKKEFVDFQYNRNYALKLCKGLGDYILLLDADMILKVKDFDKNKLDKDAYQIIQEDDRFSYQNIRLIKNNDNFFYFGRTHEVIQSKNNVNVGVLNKDIIYIDDITDGFNKDNKLERDLKLLKLDIKEYPNIDRFKFYIANTYFNLELFELAEKFYKQRIELRGWDEEIWYCYYKLGIINIINKNYDKAIINFLNAYNYNIKRIENLYYLVKVYKILKMDNLAKLYIDKIYYNIKNHKNDIFLFKDLNIYNLF